MTELNILVFVSLIVLPVLCASQSPSYGELAANLTVPAYEAMMKDLAALSNVSKPEDAKRLRKSITTARDHLDLFVYAYPCENLTDFWYYIRKDLNRGHSVVGAFKDLYDSGVNYTHDEMVAARDLVLSWKSWMQSPATAQRNCEYLASPLLHSFNIRPKTELSAKVFWGSVDTLPRTNLTGFENFALLVDASLENANGHWNVVRAVTLSELINANNVELYHDFRKAIHAIVNTAHYFPQIFTAPEADHYVAMIFDAYSRLGKIMDVVTAYHFSLDRGQADRAAELQETLVNMWGVFISWTDDVNLQKTFQILRSYLIAHLRGRHNRLFRGKFYR